MTSLVHSKLTDKMVVVQNALDGYRHKTTMVVDQTNNGGSHLSSESHNTELSKDPNSITVNAVLLSDVVNAAVAVEKPKHIVMKVDIEMFECRAFLGSPEG